MKTIKTTLPLFFLLILSFASRATVLFSDSLNYPNGCIETDGLWFAYSPAAPNTNAYVANNLLVLIPSSGEDSVAAPGGANYPAGYTNNDGSFNIASFTINVSQLPSADQYFAQLMQIATNSDVADVAHIFIDTKGTQVPGTYRLALANTATSFGTAGVTNYPMDLATGVTYTVVFSYDPNQNDDYPGGFMWINPSSIDDNPIFATDVGGSAAQNDIVISGIGFSPYASASIGDVNVGTQFSDVDSGIQTSAPQIGVQPQSASIYASNTITLYTAASAIDVVYQWYSNGVQLSDSPNVVGSVSNILVVSNLDTTANYSVVASSGGFSTTSTVAMITVDTTPTEPFFTLEPANQTNTDLSPITLSALANGTGPISYQWYFEPAGGGSFAPVSGATGPTYTFAGGYNTAGQYYCLATGGDGSNQSKTVTVVILQPELQSIASLLQLCALTNVVHGAGPYLNGGQIFDVEGIVTTIGQIESKTSTEFFIQDGTGGVLVYDENVSPSNAPPAGSLINVVSQIENYYGQPELDPQSGSATNLVQLISSNNAVPAPLLITNVALVSTGVYGDGKDGAYASALQSRLVTLTNVYLYTSKTPTGPPTGTYPVNSAQTLYAFQQPYQAGVFTNYIIVYVYTYTNSVNQLSTNYWGQPLPGFAYQLTGVLAGYNTNVPEIYPSRFQDIVTNQLAPFPATVAVTNGTPTISWPAVVGSTYSLYSSTNILGPWNRTFGLAYYPSIGSFTDTNAASQKYYYISSP